MATLIENHNIGMQAVILAGGRGARMGELTRNNQKCMLEVDGAPMLQHVVAGLERTFGNRTSVIIATGYKGEQVQQHFGDNYNGMPLTYVHDERPLETRGRLLLAADIIKKPFLFLAGDVLTSDSALEQVANRYEQEQAKRRNNVVGVINGATDHTPASTHAVLSVANGYLTEIQHPPPPEYEKGQLRETHRAMYSLDFLDFVKGSRLRLLSRIIDEAIRTSDRMFGVEAYDGVWGNYSEPRDLEVYQDLPFLPK